MNITIESIDQKLKLDGSSELVTYLSLLLPNGESISAQVGPEVAQTIINLISQPGYVAETPAFDTIDEPVGHYEDAHIENGFDGGVFGGDLEVPEEPSSDELIAWKDLPSTTLPNQVKIELQKAGVGAHLKVSDLVELTESITERLLEEKRAPPQRTQGVVQRVQTPPVKTVPKDEMGYPRVPAIDRDPGEIAQMGTDEDGVPQL